MDRIKLFNAPHKAIRLLMGEFSKQLGRLQLSHNEEVQQVKKLGLEMVLLLKDHGDKEDEIIFASLESKKPGVIKQTEKQHQDIEIFLRQVEQMIHDLDTTLPSLHLQSFYQHFTEFQSEYLMHMIDEEKHVQQKLWKYFSNEELTGIRIKIVQSMKPEMRCMWYKYMLPAQTPEENLSLLMALKNMPDENIYKTTLQLAAETLSPAHINYLTSKLYSS